MKKETTRIECRSHNISYSDLIDACSQYVHEEKDSISRLGHNFPSFPPKINKICVYSGKAKL